MKIIGFDFDGTLIDIEYKKSRLFGKLLKNHWNINSEEAQKYWITTAGTSRRSKFDHLFKKQFKKTLSDKEYTKIEKKFRNLLEKEYTKAKLLKGSMKLMNFCRKEFDLVFCSSGVPHKEINRLVKMTGLEKYFDRILGTNKKYANKEHHFQEILKNKKPDLILFVGDGMEDMRVGKKFGAITIGVTSHQKANSLLKAGAVHTCNQQQIKKIIENVLSQ